MIKTCVICGAEFNAPKRNSATCGDPECKAARRAQVVDAFCNATIARHAAARVKITCAVCGKSFEVPRSMESHYSTCSAECRSTYFSRLQKERGEQTRNRKPCAVCGRAFCAPPSSMKQTCSRQCSRKNRAQIAENHPDHLAEMQDGIKRSPVLQPDERHVNAKDFALVSPDGARYTGRNLRHFVRSHLELFGALKPKAAANAATRLSALRRCPESNWHGWTWAE